jgi:hypothetical protein
MPVIGPFLSMDAPPSSLDAIEPQIRSKYAEGWRPKPADGPSCDELDALIAAQ